MDNVILVSFESDRNVAYYKLNGKIYRRELYNLNEIFKNLNIKNYDDGIKRGLIKECLNTDKELVILQSEFVKQQLNGNFLDGLSNPLNDDAVCEEIFDKLLSNKLYRGVQGTRKVRLNKDKISPSISVSINELVKNYAKILSIILKLDTPLKAKLEKYISYECINKLIEHANDLEYLKKVLTPLICIVEKGFTNLVIFDKESDINLKNGYLCRERDLKEYPELFSFNNKDILEIFNFFKYNIDLKDELFVGPDNSTRIYLNIHDENILLQFLTCYVEECLKHKLPYNMKGMYKSQDLESCDTTILYGDVRNLKSRIEIIEKILLQHPKWREKFQEPVYGASRFGTGFYGVCYIGHLNTAGNNDETFNEYYERICEMSIGCMIARILIEKKLISSSHPKYNYLISLINLDNIKIDENEISRLRFRLLDDNMLKFCESLVKNIDKEVIQQGLKEMGYSVFRDYMKRIHCIAQHLPMSDKADIAVDRKMLEYFNEIKKKEIDGVKEISVSKSTEYKNEVMQRYRNLLKKFNQLKEASIDTGILSYEHKINDIYSEILLKSKNGFTIEEKEELLELINRMEMIFDSKLTTKSDSKEEQDKKNIIRNIKNICDSMKSFDDWKSQNNVIAQIIKGTDLRKVDIELYQKLLKDLEKAKEEYLSSDDDMRSLMTFDMFDSINDDLLSIGAKNINENNIALTKEILVQKLYERQNRILNNINREIALAEGDPNLSWQIKSMNIYKEVLEKISSICEKVPITSEQSILLYKDIYDKLKGYRKYFYKGKKTENLVVTLNLAGEFKRQFESPLMQLEALENDLDKGTSK